MSTPGRTSTDGSAGDTDYGRVGVDYAAYRRPEPRIAALVHSALGPGRTVLNVGAGTGSYEPTDRVLTAVEPSATMRAQRPAELPAAIDATAERLPFPDRAFDATMTTYSLHQWGDLAGGLAELRRVTIGPIVMLTGDPERVARFWLTDYAPEVVAKESARYPTPARIGGLLGGRTSRRVVPVPLDCTDGFIEAYYGRPERLLEPEVRRACSAWSFVSDREVAESVDRLRGALSDGSWDARYGHLRSQPSYDGSLVLLVNVPE